MDQAQGARIRSIVAEQLGVDVSEVTPDASILDDLGADGDVPAFEVWRRRIMSDLGS